MKKNVRNALAISGLALAIGASGLTLTASANENRGARILRSHQERIIRTKKLRTEKTMPAHRFVVGLVSGISDNSLTITSGSKTYTVNIPANTRLLNRSWGEIKMTDIQKGHKIKISGKITELNIAAKTIRDISLL
jgi:hypothetical protein